MARYRIALAAIACALVAGMSPAASDPQFGIATPTGWTHADGQAPVLSYWFEPNPSGFRQNLNLVAQSFDGTLAEYVAFNMNSLKNMGSGVDLGPDSDVQTCGDHPAHFFSWKSVMFGRHLIFEQVASVWGGHGYVLTYTREQDQPASDDARAALTTLCIR